MTDFYFRGTVSCQSSCHCDLFFLEILEILKDLKSQKQSPGGVLQKNLKISKSHRKTPVPDFVF